MRAGTVERASRDDVIRHAQCVAGAGHLVPRKLLPPRAKTFEELSKITAPQAEIDEEFRLPDLMSKWKAEGRRNVPKSFDDLTPFPNGRS